MATPITFLEMCNEMAAECGISGGSIASVEGQTGESLNVVKWVRKADMYVKSLYWDWEFLWAEASGTLSINTDTVPRSSDLFMIKRDSMVIRKALANHHEPIFVEWKSFSPLYERGVKSTVTNPAHWTIRPDTTLPFLLSEKLKADNEPYYYEYWKRPVAMAENTDVSEITPFDEEEGRIIIAKAKMAYAAREDAPEVMAEAAAEYSDRLDRLMSAALPGHRNKYMGSGEDDMLVVGTRDETSLATARFSRAT